MAELHNLTSLLTSTVGTVVHASTDLVSSPGAADCIQFAYSPVCFCPGH